MEERSGRMIGLLERMNRKWCQIDQSKISAPGRAGGTPAISHLPPSGLGVSVYPAGPGSFSRAISSTRASWASLTVAPAGVNLVIHHHGNVTSPKWSLMPFLHPPWATPPHSDYVLYLHCKTMYFVPSWQVLSGKTVCQKNKYKYNACICPQ